MTVALGTRVAFVTAVLLAVLVGMVALRQWPLTTGREVVLATAPVDPRSMLRGDYVDLSYEVSRLSDSAMPLPDVRPGDVVYVPLTGPDADGLWHPAGVMTESPIGPIPFLRGMVQSHWEEPGAAAGNESASCLQERCRTLLVTYGIESYFVPENTGRDLEDLAREGGRLAVAIAIDGRGGAVIAGLIVDGRRVSREGLL